MKRQQKGWSQIEEPASQSLSGREPIQCWKPDDDDYDDFDDNGDSDGDGDSGDGDSDGDDHDDERGASKPVSVRQSANPVLKTWYRRMVTMMMVIVIRENFT